MHNPLNEQKAVRDHPEHCSNGIESGRFAASVLCGFENLEKRVAEAPREISKSAPCRKMSTLTEVLAVSGKLKNNTAGLPQSEKIHRLISNSC